MISPDTLPCPLCQTPTPVVHLREARWAEPDVIARLVANNPHWRLSDGACPACVQQNLLTILLERGEDALHKSIQNVWPLDPQAAFGALPTPLRLHADPRFTGKGTTIAFIDSGFYPLPDLVKPHNRIRAWVNVATDNILGFTFSPDESPAWPGWNAANIFQWHGLMTSVTAAGNGWLSHGLYRGLASEADVVLVQVRDGSPGPITNHTITRALNWLLENGEPLGVRVVNISLGGEPVTPLRGNAVDEAIAELTRRGVSVTVAAGNDGVRSLVPPATAPDALTVGGLDDQNIFDHDSVQLWHSNYGDGTGGLPKPELVAPSIWVAAPVLPCTEVAQEANTLFLRRNQKDSDVEGRLAELKLITPHYQHVDGTSFAAPITASTIACMLEANKNLTPGVIRDILLSTAQPVPGADPARQGAGALDAGRAVSRALAERHNALNGIVSPRVGEDSITFTLHDHHARYVEITGSWNDWLLIPAKEIEPGLWQVVTRRPTAGQYVYKFHLDGQLWLDDPANPHKVPDGFGGFNSVFVIV